MTVLRLAMTTFPVSGTLPPMSYGSQRAVLLFKCAACAVVLAVAGMARSYGGACCLCEAVRPWQSMPVTPRGVLQNRMACKVDCRVAMLLAMTLGALATTILKPWQSMFVIPRNLCNSARFAGWIAASLCSSQ